MDCHVCGGPTVAFRAPADLQEYAVAATSEDAVADGAAIAVCTRCLAVQAADDQPDEQPAPRAVSDALPADPDAAVALLLAASFLDSIAGNRSTIGALVDRAERAGADPALVFERLAVDPDLEPTVDLPRRYRQFEQMRD